MVNLLPKTYQVYLFWKIMFFQKTPQSIQCHRTGFFRGIAVDPAAYGGKGQGFTIVGCCQMKRIFIA